MKHQEAKAKGAEMWVQALNTKEFISPICGRLRVMLNSEGKVWFCLSDIAEALGLDKHSKQIGYRLKNTGVCLLYARVPEGLKRVPWVNEYNLYRCVFRSTKPEALVYQDWLFEEVLPSIRKEATIQANEPEAIGGVYPLYYRGAWYYHNNELLQAIGYTTEAQRRAITQRAKSRFACDVLDIHGCTYLTARLAVVLSDERKIEAEAQSTAQALPTEQTN